MKMHLVNIMTNSNLNEKYLKIRKNIEIFPEDIQIINVEVYLYINLLHNR
jgi:hypothetical protein